MPAKTATTSPTHEQAKLHLQLYEQRREPRLREARDWFSKNYFAKSMEESMRIAAPGTDNGAFVMMVFSYWRAAQLRAAARENRRLAWRTRSR